MMHVFPVMLLETRATLHASASGSAEYTEPYEAISTVNVIQKLIAVDRLSKQASSL